MSFTNEPNAKPMNPELAVKAYTLRFQLDQLKYEALKAKETYMLANKGE